MRKDCDSFHKAFITIRNVMLFVFCTTACLGQAKLYLFELANNNNTMYLSNGKLISAEIAAYQTPVFHPSHSLLYFISDGTTQTNILIHDYQSAKDSLLINTKGSKSALTITPDKKFLSAIVTAQDEMSLVKYALEDGEATVIIPSVQFINYAWVSDNSMMVLKSGKPNSIALYTIRPKQEMRIAENVGQCLKTFFNSPSVTFIHKLSVEYSTVKRVNEKDGSIAVVTDALPEQEVFAWTPRGILIMYDGEKLVSFNENADAVWRNVIADKSVNLNNVSGMAVNPSGTKMALVVSD